MDYCKQMDNILDYLVLPVKRGDTTEQQRRGNPKKQARDENVAGSFFAFQPPKKVIPPLLKGEKSKGATLKGENPQAHYLHTFTENVFPKHKRPIRSPIKVPPLIEVTVTENNSEKSPRKTRRVSERIQKHSVNKVQSSISIHSSTKKNIYVVLSGRRREKLYEVVSTKSVKLSDGKQDDNIRLDTFTHFKSIFASLDMDRKKKKGKKEKSREDLKSPPSSLKDYQSRGNESLVDLAPTRVDSKSHIKIMGRLGLTQDDRLVLKCAATVNDKPILTKVNSPWKSNLFEDNATECPMVNCCQNFCGQNNVSLGVTTSCNGIVKESQGTQVDFFSVQNTTFVDDKSIQCGCWYDTRPNLVQYPEERIVCPAFHEGYAVENENKNPVVVISVFPTKEALNETIPGRSASDYPNIPALPSPPSEWLEQQDKQDKQKTRKPSPAKKTGKKTPPPKTSAKNITDKSTDSVRGKSPVKGKKALPKTKTEGVKKTQSKTKNKVEASRSLSPKTKPKGKEAKASAIDNKRTSELKSPREKRVMPNVHIEEPSSLYAGNSRASSQLKKDLVDSFFNSSKGYNNTKQPSSKVTINIDSEKEYYDVLFNQSKMRTDVTVRKTVKSIGLQKNNNDEESGTRTQSMGNYLAVENYRNDSRISPVNYSTDLIEQTQSPLARLHVRDSLEIKHRRDHSLDVGANSKSNNDFERRSTVLRHFKGDNCSILDPVQRDKEIRELLGVHNRRSGLLQSDVYGNMAKDDESLIQSENFLTEKPHDKDYLTEHPYEGSSCKSNDELPMEYYFQHQRNKHGTSNLSLNNSLIVCLANSDDLESKPDNQKCRLIPPFSNLYGQNKQSLASLTMGSQDSLIPSAMHTSKPITLTRMQYTKIKRTLERPKCRKQRFNQRNDSYVSVDKIKARSLLTIHQHSDDSMKILDPRVKPASQELICNKNYISDKICELRDHGKETKDNRGDSLEVFCSKCSCAEQVLCSPPHQGIDIVTDYAAGKSESLSLHTIFKGHKKTVTPNLGASAYSLDLISSDPYITRAPNPCRMRPKKQFILWKLISYLVMMGERKERNNSRLPSVTSSIDSYHLSSMGDQIIPSSVYDTSISFYTDHSVTLSNTKPKRGFVNSVRDFIGRKS